MTDRHLTDADPNTHDMMTILDEEEFVASAVVYPGSTEEVQQVVQWANKHRIPIFPISMGRNCMAAAFAIQLTDKATLTHRQ